MADIKWPIPAAYIVSNAMAADRLWWSRDPKALNNVPLYTKEQVERMLRAAGVKEVLAPEFKLVGNADFHMSAELDVCIGDDLYIRPNGVKGTSGGELQ